MSTINPLDVLITLGNSRDTLAQGGAQQQRWLQELERTWLHSWQQAGAAPGDSEGHAASSGPAARPVVGEPAPPHAIKPPIVPEAGSVDVAGDRMASPGTTGAQSSATHTPAAGRMPTAAATDLASAAPQSPLPHAVLPTRALPVQLQAAQPAARKAAPAPAVPATPGPQVVSLNVREAGADSVMAALRDSRLSAAVSQAAAAALARQLAQAGYAQVQVYVNGTELRRQATEPKAHQQEKPHRH